MRAMILRTWKTWRLLRSRKADAVGSLMMFLGAACAIVSAFDADMSSMPTCIVCDVCRICTLRVALVLVDILAASSCSRWYENCVPLFISCLTLSGLPHGHVLFVHLPKLRESHVPLEPVTDFCTFVQCFLMRPFIGFRVSFSICSVDILSRRL